MADPVTLSVLGSWAAAEGVKFLYGQAAELLKASRESRKRAATADRDTALVEVPIVATEVLDRPPSAAAADLAVVEEKRASIEELTAALSNYAQGLADVDNGDERLARQAGDLRAILEEVYGQRFTFRGEDREPTGSRVTVSQVFGDVAGQVTGARADVRDGELGVWQDVSTVRPDGSVTGFDGTVGR